MTTKLYRARTNIGAPGKPRAKAGGKIPLNDAAARELIDIDAIDPEPLGEVPADAPVNSVAIPDHAALSAMKVAELKALAKQLGITGQDNSTKASIIAAIDAKATGTTSDAS